MSGHSHQNGAIHACPLLEPIVGLIRVVFPEQRSGILVNWVFRVHGDGPVTSDGCVVFQRRHHLRRPLRRLRRQAAKNGPARGRRYRFLQRGLSRQSG